MIGKRGILILDGVLLSGVVLAWPLGKLLMSLPFGCPFTSIGYLCPACGGTRAVLSFLQGNIQKAFSMNAYFVVTGFAVAMGLIALHMSCFTNIKFFHRVSKGFFHPYTGAVWAVGFLVFGFLRNIF